MKEHRYGRIVNMSSLAGLLGLVGQVHYATVKAGLVGFTYGVAKELAQFGITVNAIQPGLIRSNLTGPVLAMLGDSLADETPIPRIGEPSDVAGAVAFLASPDSGFITGTVVKVAGAYELTSGLDRFMHGVINASHVAPAGTGSSEGATRAAAAE
jgi:3-oxoacyl-[acyl-carrier protein] reductase